MAKSISCIVPDGIQASKIVGELKTSGFSSEDISVLLAEKSASHAFAHEHNTKAPEGIATGATAGGVVGGTLGWLAGIGTLTLPGVGPFIVAGPLMAALGGAGAGAIVGGIAGALVGLGIPEIEAKRYEGKIKSGGVLVSVHSEDPARIERARQIFDHADAEDISTSSPVAISSQERAEKSKTDKKVTSYGSSSRKT
jgi:hypothetical protein